MDIRKNIPELCNELGISASMAEDWRGTSAELTITVPTYYGIDIKAMRAEEYLYAALQGIYMYKQGYIQKREKNQTDTTVLSKKLSRLARLLKRHK